MRNVSPTTKLKRRQHFIINHPGVGGVGIFNLINNNNFFNKKYNNNNTHNNIISHHHVYIIIDDESEIITLTLTITMINLWITLTTIASYLSIISIIDS